MMLESTVSDLAAGLDDSGIGYELIVVENGSLDNTLDLAKALADKFHTVRVLSLPVGDYGAALREGFRAARGEVVVNFDVDYYDLTFLRRALELLGETDAAIVVASKRAPGASDRRPLHRRLITFVFTSLLGRLFGLPVTDAHGMKAMRRVAVAPLVEACVMTRALFDVELVLRAGRAGMRVLEVPAFVVELRPARSAITTRAVETLIGLVRLAVVLRRNPTEVPSSPQPASAAFRLGER
jgi:glycosyltransferase involved in cell wall biosynthesis